jgi:hypothetical protein
MTNQHPCPPLAKITDAWAEHELTRLYRQSSLSYAGEHYRWALDKNLEAIGSPNPWVITTPLDPDLSTWRLPVHYSFTIPTRSTAPQRHTTLDEFGFAFRSILWEAQCQIIISHFEGYEMLATLRVVEGDRQWRELMNYLETLSPQKEALSKIIAASWLVLKVEWSKRRRHLARNGA